MLPEVICKLNVEKVQDRVNWEFLIYLIRNMDLGQYGAFGLGNAHQL